MHTKISHRLTCFLLFPEWFSLFFYVWHRKTSILIFQKIEIAKKWLKQWSFCWSTHFRLSFEQYPKKAVSFLFKTRFHFFPAHDNITNITEAGKMVKMLFECLKKNLQFNLPIVLLIGFFYKLWKNIQTCWSGFPTDHFQIVGFGPKLQRHSVYYHMWQRKASNPHIWVTGTWVYAAAFLPKNSFRLIFCWLGNRSVDQSLQFYSQL